MGNKEISEDRETGKYKENCGTKHYKIILFRIDQWILLVFSSSIELIKECTQYGRK